MKTTEIFCAILILGLSNSFIEAKPIDESGIQAAVGEGTKIEATQREVNTDEAAINKEAADNSPLQDEDADEAVENKPAQEEEDATGDVTDELSNQVIAENEDDKQIDEASATNEKEVVADQSTAEEIWDESANNNEEPTDLIDDKAAEIVENVNDEETKENLNKAQITEHEEAIPLEELIIESNANKGTSGTLKNLLASWNEFKSLPVNKAKTVKIEEPIKTSKTINSLVTSWAYIN